LRLVERIGHLAKLPWIFKILETLKPFSDLTGSAFNLR
jgi:hypothetical protein